MIMNYQQSTLNPVCEYEQLTMNCLKFGFSCIISITIIAGSTCDGSLRLQRFIGSRASWVTSLIDSHPTMKEWLPRFRGSQPMENVSTMNVYRSNLISSKQV